MASRPQSKAIGGVTPLGVITLAAGTPVQLTAALGLTDKVYTFSARQLGFSVSGLVATTAAEVYVNYGNYSGLDTNATVLIIQKGGVQSLPINTSATEGLIDATQYWLDCNTGAAKVAVYALDASN
jgi:hypothetical protein